MNKKTIILLGIIGVLIVAALAALLIGSAGYTMDTKVRATTEAACQTADPGSTQSTAESVTEDQTEQIGQTGEEPSFLVDFGVGERLDFGQTDTTGSTQESLSTQSQGTHPTQEQSTEGTLDAEKGKNGLPDKLLTYEEFLALSNEDQQAYFFCFDDPIQYAQWLRQAQQDYEDGRNSIVVTGPVDLETLP